MPFSSIASVASGALAPRSPASKLPAFRSVASRSLAALAAVSAVAGPGAPAAAQSGAASWYGSGHRTANGERFDPNALTAAHRSLPFGTRVRVETRTGRAVVVRINDRGPFVHGRIIDLSRGSARALGMGGTTYVSLRVLP